jgi:hypothetical protein
MQDPNLHAIQVCNNLLRGEVSAGQTYGQAILKYQSEPVTAELDRIRKEHADASVVLCDLIRSYGGVPDEHSGTWGVFAMAIQAAANLFGTESAIEALHRGEAKGLKDYEDALNDPALVAGVKEVVRGDLAPRIIRHIQALDRLEQLVHEADEGRGGQSPERG